MAAVLTLVLWAVATAPATACDPEWGWCGFHAYDPYWDFLLHEPISGWWAEAAYEPVPEPLVVAPDPGVAAAALGLHRVTEVWTGHITTTAGPVTTYASTSAEIDAGTYARVVATVGTGETTAYDGVVLGGRTTLTDGRVVAGDVYANYIWNGDELVLSSYVFFQDDAEIARLRSIATATPTPSPSAHVAQPIIAPATPTLTSGVVSALAPVFVTPVIGDIPSERPGPPPSIDTPAPTPPERRAVRIGISLAPQAEPIGRAEVLRGRRVLLFTRAFVDEVSSRVSSWRLISGELTAIGPVTGTGDEPLMARFETVTPPGATFVVRLRATIEVQNEGLRELDATIEVAVRSPAIVE